MAAPSPRWGPGRGSAGRAQPCREPRTVPRGARRTPSTPLGPPPPPRPTGREEQDPAPCQARRDERGRKRWTRDKIAAIGRRHARARRDGHRSPELSARAGRSHQRRGGAGSSPGTAGTGGPAVLPAPLLQPPHSQSAPGPRHGEQRAGAAAVPKVAVTPRPSRHRLTGGFGSAAPTEGSPMERGDGDKNESYRTPVSPLPRCRPQPRREPLSPRRVPAVPSGRRWRGSPGPAPAPAPRGRRAGSSLAPSAAATPA